MTQESPSLSPLIHLLRCVRCFSELKQENGRAALACSSCGASYPIIDSTPRMLPSENPGRDKERTAASFAYEWSQFGSLRAEWEQNFMDYLQPLQPEDLRGKLLLDVGAGSGRHSFYAAAAGAQVVAVDLGEAIDVARRNLPADVLTVQADAEALPFAPESFDIVMSIGVLHHLRAPEAGIQRLVPLVRPGGRLHIYLYWVPERRWHRVLLRGVNAARHVTTRMPHRLLHALCYPLAAALLFIFVAPYRTLRRRPRSARAASTLPLKTYADYPFAVLVNDQFDRLSAPIEHRYTRSQVAEMIRRAGLEDVIIIENHGWVADAIRPLSGA